MNARSKKAVGTVRETDSSHGFTLLELLLVVALAAILAAILIPTVGAARVAASKARTRVQFSQWTAALEMFRSEYGYYPSFPGNLVNGGASGSDHPFHDVLAGRRRDGAALTAGSAAAAQNPKRIAFYSFSHTEFVAEGGAAGLLCDGAGGTEIAVLVDRNLDGAIDGSDYGTLPQVAAFRPVDDFPADGLRATVVFYAPAPGATLENPAFVFSWK